MYKYHSFTTSEHRKIISRKWLRSEPMVKQPSRRRRSKCNLFRKKTVCPRVIYNNTCKRRRLARIWSNFKNTLEHIYHRHRLHIHTRITRYRSSSKKKKISNFFCKTTRVNLWGLGKNTKLYVLRWKKKRICTRYLFYKPRGTRKVYLNFFSYIITIVVVVLRCFFMIITNEGFVFQKNDCTFFITIAMKRH